MRKPISNQLDILAATRLQPSLCLRCLFLPDGAKATRAHSHARKCGDTQNVSGGRPSAIKPPIRRRLPARAASGSPPRATPRTHRICRSSAQPFFTSSLIR